MGRENHRDIPSKTIIAQIVNFREKCNFILNSISVLLEIIMFTCEILTHMVWILINDKIIHNK